jgi:hypothetical protein
MYTDTRCITLEGDPDDVWRGLARGDGHGTWYAGDVLWRIRGFADRLIGGPGLRTKRADAVGVGTGDVIDSWHVIVSRPPGLLQMVSELRMPGSGELEFRIRPVGEMRTELVQIARFAPAGLWGRLYWYAVLPAHVIAFNRMLRMAARRIGRPVLSGPKRCVVAPLPPLDEGDLG